MTKSVVIEFYKCFSITSGLQPFTNSRLCRNHSEEKLPLSMPVGIWTTDTLQINWTMRGKSPLLCGTSCPRHGRWVNVIFKRRWPTADCRGPRAEGWLRFSHFQIFSLSAMWKKKKKILIISDDNLDNLPAELSSLSLPLPGRLSPLKDLLWCSFPGWL